MRRLLPRDRLFERSRIVGSHGTFVNALCWQPAWRTLISADQRGCIARWILPSVSAGRQRMFDPPILGLACEGDVIVAWGWRGQLVRARGDILLSFEGHRGNVVSAAISNGQLVSGGHDQTLRRWDLATGELLWTSPKRAFWVTRVVPLPDGRIVALVQYDAVELWSWDETPTRVSGEGFKPAAITVDANNGLLASGDEEGRLEVWDLAEGTRRHTLAPGWGGIACIETLPGGLFAIGHHSGRVSVLDPESGALSCLGQHAEGVLGLTGWDGHVASWGLDRAVMAWDIEARACIGRHDDHNKICLAGLALDLGRGVQVITASGDGTVRAWDPSTSPASPTASESHIGGVSALAWFDDESVISAAADGVRRWATSGDVALLSGQRDTRRLRIDAGEIYGFADDYTISVWDHRGRQLRQLGCDQTWFGATVAGPELVLARSRAGQVWAMHTAAPFEVLWKTHAHKEVCTDLAVRGEKVISVGRDGQAVLMGLHDGHIERRFDVGGQPLQAAAWIDDFTFLTRVRGSGDVHLWRPHVDGEQIASRATAIGACDGHGVIGGSGYIEVTDGPLIELSLGAVRVLLPCGGSLLAVGQDLRLSMVDVSSGAVVWSVATKARLHITLARHDSGTLALAAHKTIELIHEGQRVAELSARGEVNDLSFAGEMLWVATDRALELWRWREGRLLDSFKHHDGNVAAVCSLATGVASLGYDHSVAIWTPEGQLRGQIDGHKGYVTGGARLPNGDLVSFGFDGGVLTWDHDRVKSRVQTKEIICGAVSPSGRYALVGRFDGRVQPVELEDGARLGEPVTVAAKLFAAAEQRDRSRVAFAASHARVSLWRLDDEPGTHEADVEVFSDELFALSWAPDDLLYVAGSDGPKRYAIRSVGPGVEVRELTSIDFRPRALDADASRVVVGGHGGHIAVVDRATGEVTDTVEMAAEVWCLALRHNRLAAGDADGNVHVYELVMTATGD